MRATVSDSELRRDEHGEWLCLRTDKAREILATMQAGTAYDIDIKRHRQLRSLSANAYYWVLVDRLAEHMGVSKTEIYRQMIPEIGGNCELVQVCGDASNRLATTWQARGQGWVAVQYPRNDGWVDMILYYGSSTYDTKQMSRLIELAVQECHQQGIETMDEAELQSLIAAWQPT